MSLKNPKYRGVVEYLSSYGGKEVHVVQPGSTPPSSNEVDL